MARRGFLAEMQYQARQAEKRRAQAARQQASAQAARSRDYQRALKDSERAQAQAQRADAAERKAMEKELARLHVEERLAHVESLNADLDAAYAEIDSMLSATLAVDDFVDLEELRVQAQYPPFHRTDLEVAEPPPASIPTSAEPRFAPPPEPTGLSAKLGGAARHAKQFAEAQALFTQQHQAWQMEQRAADEQWQQLHQAWQLREQARMEQAGSARAEYQAACQQVDVQVAEQNAQLDALLAGLSAGSEEAIQSYVGIVLANSVYPETFPIEYDYQFDASLGELELLVTVPGPSAMPSIKAYKYVKASDEITSSPLTKAALKERYSNAIAQVAIRSLHEVFEADRQGLIQTIAMAVATNTVNPATGLAERVFLASCAADRARFMQFDLTNVVPAATLTHLNGQLSKNAYDLVPIDMSSGVRGK